MFRHVLVRWTASRRAAHFAHVCLPFVASCWRSWKAPSTPRTECGNSMIAIRVLVRTYISIYAWYLVFQTVFRRTCIRSAVVFCFCVRTYDTSACTYYINRYGVHMYLAPSTQLAAVIRFDEWCPYRYHLGTGGVCTLMMIMIPCISVCVLHIKHDTVLYIHPSTSSESNNVLGWFFVPREIIAYINGVILLQKVRTEGKTLVKRAKHCQSKWKNM